MHDIFNYCVVTNTGKGFITGTDRSRFWIRGYPANVWACADGMDSRIWIERNSGTPKTKTEAQALITAETDAAKTAWDADERDAGVHEPTGKGDRPPSVTLPSWRDL